MNLLLRSICRHLRLHLRREDEIGELSAVRSLIQIKGAGRRAASKYECRVIMF